MARPPHKSAYVFQELLWKEMADFVKKAFWMMLPYHKVKKLRKFFRRLRVSLIGVIPQKDQQLRIIVDYSYWGLNKETLKLSAQDTMQFGRALERIITKVAHANPRFGPVKFIKIDLANGFYCVWVRAEDIPKLGAALPVLDDKEPLIAFPLVLPMGWTEPPLYFWAATETITDIANQRIRRWENPKPHPLEIHAEVDLPTLSLSANQPKQKAHAAAIIPTPLQLDPL